MKVRPLSNEPVEGCLRLRLTTEAVGELNRRHQVECRDSRGRQRGQEGIDVLKLLEVREHFAVNEVECISDGCFAIARVCQLPLKQREFRTEQMNHAACDMRSGEVGRKTLSPPRSEFLRRNRGVHPKLHMSSRNVVVTGLEGDLVREAMKASHATLFALVVPKSRGFEYRADLRAGSSVNLFRWLSTQQAIARSLRRPGLSLRVRRLE